MIGFFIGAAAGIIAGVTLAAFALITHDDFDLSSDPWDVYTDDQGTDKDKS
jgi:hypothetical protein